MSLYAEQADALDRTTQALTSAGYPKANRSLVAQAAIDRLQDELSGKTPEEIVRFFGERHLRRPLKTLQSRRQADIDSGQLNLPLSNSA